ncbi:hypothetical protein [Desulfobacula sp.]
MAFIKLIHRYHIILIILAFGIFPSIIKAKIFITTQIVSGQVISITKEYTIELDDGFLYYPTKKDTPCSVNPGEFISIRYFIDTNDKKNYIDHAPGKNSLKPVPLPKSTIKPKTML